MPVGENIEVKVGEKTYTQALQIGSAGTLGRWA
jgi:hypothetical protein